MTKFDYQRLTHFIKSAEKCDWIQLGPADLDILEFINRNIKDAAAHYSAGYQDGFEDGQNNLLTISEDCDIVKVL